MVTELAFLSIRPGEHASFEAAFACVSGLLAAADGHRAHRLVPSLDHADLYVLEVQWRDLAAHVDMFEPSDSHARFMAALEPFFAAEPRVLHVPARSADD
jgi:heme-degrading monooxygenase HmoA